MDNIELSDVDQMIKDLTFNDKVTYNLAEDDNCKYYLDKFSDLKNLYENSHIAFLEKSYKYILPDKYFKNFECYDRKNPIINHYLNKIEKKLDINYRKIVRNRRNKKLDILIKSGEYFSYEEMKTREPILYQKYIGQFMEDGEEEIALNRQFNTFSGFLLNNLLHIEDRVRMQEAVSTNDNLESDSDDDNESEVDESGNKIKIDAEIKQQKAHQFLEIMSEKFLAGEEDFNYEEIDNDSDLDDLAEQARDMEDDYFSAESSESDNDIDVDMNEENDNEIDEFIEYKDRAKLNNLYRN